MRSTVDDYYRIRWVGNGAISPSGKTLVYTLTRTEKPDTEISELLIRDLDVQSSQDRVLTSGKDPVFLTETTVLFTDKTRKIPDYDPEIPVSLQKTTGAVWSNTLSPSSAAADPGIPCTEEPDTDQLFLLDLETGKRTQLTHMRFGVSSPVVSPDGSRIAFTSNVENICPEEYLDREPSQEEVRKEHLEYIHHPYVTFEDYGYKSDEYGGFSVGKYWTLWSLVPGEKPVKLSDGDRDHVMPVFSADSQTIYFVSNRERERNESIAMDLFSVPAGGGEIQRITKDDWIAYYPAPFHPIVSPDGKAIVYGALAPSDLLGNMPLTRLFRLDLENSGEPSLSLWNANAPAHEATCFLYNCENLGTGSRSTAAYDSEGKYVYFISGWHGACNIFRAATDHTEITAVTKESCSYRSITRFGSRYLLSRGDFTHTPQLYLATEEMMRGEEGWAPIQLTDSNPWMEDVLSKPEEMWIDTLDGEARVQGFVFPPQEMEPGKKYPAVVYIHGGPTPFMGAALTYEHQCITGAGMGLIILNFRGSSGYGEAFQSMKKAYDGSAMTDILQFTREAAEKYDWIDAGRLGVTGGSFGGYMTNWITSHTKVFKAAVTQRSIANDLIEYASSDYAGKSAKYESFSDFIRDGIRTSSVSYAENVDIPFLILHGMNDMRCPMEQAHQLFSAVKETHPDNPVKMILYPGMTHSFPMEGPMDLRIHHYSAMMDWFKKYL